MGFDKNNMTKEQLAQLRSEIVLNSLFINDYKNSFEIDPKAVCTFFDGFVEFISEEMEEDGYKDAQFWEVIEKYDTIEYLEEWYYMCEYPFGED